MLIPKVARPQFAAKRETAWQARFSALDTLTRIHSSGSAIDTTTLPEMGERLRAYWVGIRIQRCERPAHDGTLVTRISGLLPAPELGAMRLVRRFDEYQWAVRAWRPLSRAPEAVNDSCAGKLEVLPRDAPVRRLVAGPSSNLAAVPANGAAPSPHEARSSAELPTPNERLRRRTTFAASAQADAPQSRARPTVQATRYRAWVLHHGPGEPEFHSTETSRTEYIRGGRGGNEPSGTDS